MSEPLKYRLPFPPSVNHYWRSRIVGTGKRTFTSYYISEQGKKFRANVEAICHGANTLYGRLSVRLVLILPDRRERDIDNYLKGTFDALAHAKVFGNDSQIDHLDATRGPVKPPGACEIEITEIPSDAPMQTSLLAGFLEAESEVQKELIAK